MANAKACPCTGALIIDHCLERFALRLAPEIYSATFDLAEQSNRSLNGEISQAIESWLYQYDVLCLVRDNLSVAAGATASARIRAAVPVFNCDADKGEAKFSLRIREALGDELKKRFQDMKASSRSFVSMNTYIHQILAWWLAYSFEMQELQNALHDGFVSSTMARRRDQQDSIRTLQLCHA